MKNSQKGFIVPVLLVIIAILVIGGGVYVYNNKKVETPILPTGTEVQTTNQNQQQVQGIVIEQPAKNQEVQLPIIVKGYINGNGWSAFEGVAGSVQVFDANNKAISNRVPLQAIGEWMQPVVHFEATVGDREIMSHLATQTGILVFKSEEAKDDSIAKEFRLPIKFANNQTANWKTHSSSDFSLKYPTIWYLNTSSTGYITITNYDSSLVAGSDAPISPENIVISISTYNNLSASETLESWVTKTSLSEKTNVLVDGIKAIRGRIIYTGKEESGYYQEGQLSGDYVYILYNGKGYLITYSPHGSKFVSTFDQILSTFKFTTASTTSSWKTYINNDRFYEFHYPEYATTSIAGSVISETAVKLTPNYNVSFAVTTSPNDTSLCNSNPYENGLPKINNNQTVVENKIQKDGNEYRHLSITNTTKNSEMGEERYYIVKNNICYMIVEITLYPNKVDTKVKSDLGKIFSTFKFTK